MLEIDCRECLNCDMKNARCKLYGNDPEKAARACAADGFKGYMTKDRGGSMRLIDADAAKKALTGWETAPTDEEIERTIDKIPTIEAEPVRYGRWVRSPSGLYACNVCGVNDRFGLSSNCPNCRAKMYGGTSNGNIGK